MRKLGLAMLLSASVLASCGGVTVHRRGASAPPKPRDCELEILQKPPPRPYEVLADLTSHVTVVPREGALSVLRPKACELGADALIVIQNMVLNELGHTLVAATAIRYRPETPRAEPTPAPASPEPQAAPKVEPKSDAPSKAGDEPKPGEEPRMPEGPAR
jgi:hypothetical protein